MSATFYEQHAGLRVVEQQLSGFDLTVEHGFSAAIVGQLIDKSNQYHIRDTAYADANERFRSMASFESWWLAHHGLSMYPLLANEATDLAGLICHFPEPEPVSHNRSLFDPVDDVVSANHSFEIRIYEPYTGRRLARPFMRAALQDYVQKPEVANDLDGVWLSTSASRHNQTVTALYKSFGYKMRGVSADKRDVTMVLSAKAAQQIQREYAHVGD